MRLPELLLASWWPPSLATSTFVLAVVTAVLVAATALLAWYGRKDVAAQERPVLLVDERRIQFGAETGRGNAPRLLLSCFVENAGSGPALNLEATVAWPEDLHVLDKPPLQSVSTGDAPRELRWRCFPQETVPVHWAITLAYQDLSGRSFRTDVDFNVEATYEVYPRVVQRVSRWRGHRIWTTLRLRHMSGTAI